MTEGSLCSAFESPLEGNLEERLPLIQPRLTTHLSHRSRRVRGVEPEDLAQEVVARALLYRDKYDPSRALWPWLRQVAERVILDHRSKAERKPEDSLEGEVAAPTQVPWVDSREELDRTLAALRPLEREALLRFHQHGESVREIAAAMKLPEGTVKSHLSRARRRLAGLASEDQNNE